MLADTLTRRQTLRFSTDPNPSGRGRADLTLTPGLAPGFGSPASGGGIPPGSEHCPLGELRCARPDERIRALIIPPLAIVTYLLLAFLLDLARAKLRLRQQLYMPLRHISVLLTVEVRVELSHRSG